MSKETVSSDQLVAEIVAELETIRGHYTSPVYDHVVVELAIALVQRVARRRGKAVDAVDTDNAALRRTLTVLASHDPSWSDDFLRARAALGEPNQKRSQ